MPYIRSSKVIITFPENDIQNSMISGGAKIFIEVVSCSDEMTKRKWFRENMKFPQNTFSWHYQMLKEQHLYRYTT